MNVIDIIIILFLGFFAYSGFKNGFVKELSSLIAYITAFLLSKKIAEIIHSYFDQFIPYDALKYKIAYLLSFVIIVYLFKLLSHLIEKFINMKWQNKLLGLILGIVELVPGVSAGTLALILGIYEQSISAVSSIILFFEPCK